MKVKKRDRLGHITELEIIKIKDYPRYSIYQVYKVKDGNAIPLYKQCFTEADIEKIIKNNNIIEEELTLG